VTHQPKSIIGRQLYDSFLPRLYRVEDDGDLARILDSAGVLLDLVRATLDQRLADCFPDTPFAGRVCQDWILPYLGRLFDARLLSPFPEGRRAEVANAVAWRQRKGTRPCIELIAEAVGQHEVEVGEGWQRMARTPRVAFPLLPESAFGETLTHNPASPIDMARHPGLPVVTPDFRLPSRAVLTVSGHPAARVRRNGTIWRQANPNGAPCFPDSHEDTSPRTPDFRTPTWREGYHHPRRVQVYYPPPVGFFPPGMTAFKWSERGNHPDLIVEEPDIGTHDIMNPSGGPAMITTKPPNFTDDVTVTITGIHFADTLTVKAGRLVLRNLAARRVVIDLPPGTELTLHARDCLFDELEVRSGIARLEYCTIRQLARFRWVEASDCIFPENTEIAEEKTEDTSSCIRYSRVPAHLFLSADTLIDLEHKHNVTETPVFARYRFCRDGTHYDAATFGHPGYGVLHPATPDSIRAGAEDLGEMGAYHHAAHGLAEEATRDKLADFLPVGQEAVLIPDPRLHAAPPSIS